MTWRLSLLVWLAMGGAALADDPSSQKAPLANLPSKPGPHIERIKALKDNEWLELGTPESDPQWGTARGRSWSTNQPAAPNLRGGFVFAEGVHGYTKPDGHYMNDIWFYDIHGHRWICVYPGIEVKTIAKRIKDRELTLNADGILVDQRGDPLPPLLIHAYGNHSYDPVNKQFLTFGGQFDNYFTWSDKGAFHEPYKLYQELRGDKQFPGHSPFFYSAASGRFHCFPVEAGPSGKANFGADMLVYVASKKEFFWGGSHGVWFLDSEKRRWTNAHPTGSPPVGIDHCAAYDPKRDRIFYHQHDGKTPEENFLIYDVKENNWIKPQATGHAPRACTSYESLYSYDATSDKLVVIRLFNAREGDDPHLRRGVYAYNANTNAWDQPLPLPENVVKGIKNGNFGFYDPELNAYFCYFAGDSNDDGSMWVYRHKNRP